MKLKSFGCSFVFGSDLGDEQAIKGLPIRASQRTWPALLAQNLGLDYQCWARPGAGNLQILERMLNCAQSADHNDLFVVSWTWIDRFDFYITDPTQVAWPDGNNYQAKTDWRTIRPTDDTDISRNFYRHINTEYQDKFTALIYAKTAIDTLMEKGLRFVMTYTDDLMFDQQYHTSPAMRNLQDSVAPHMTKFEGQTFLQWSRAKGFAESVNWHPLSRAHESASNLIIKSFDKQRTNDPVQQVLV